MESQNQPVEEPISRPAKWVSDDDTISNFGHYSAIGGAVLGFGLVLSSDLHCRIIGSSQGCGFDSIDSALFFYALMMIVIGVIGLGVGRQVGKLPPSLRRVGTVFSGLLFFSQFAWSEVLSWLRPDLVGTFWQKAFADWMLIGLTGIGFVVCFFIKRRAT